MTLFYCAVPTATLGEDTKGYCVPNTWHQGVGMDNLCRVSRVLSSLAYPDKTPLALRQHFIEKYSEDEHYYTQDGADPQARFRIFCLDVQDEYYQKLLEMQGHYLDLDPKEFTIVGYIEGVTNEGKAKLILNEKAQRSQIEKFKEQFPGGIYTTANQDFRFERTRRINIPEPRVVVKIPAAVTLAEEETHKKSFWQAYGKSIQMTLLLLSVLFLFSASITALVYVILAGASLTALISIGSIAVAGNITLTTAIGCKLIEPVERDRIFKSPIGTGYPYEPLSQHSIPTGVQANNYTRDRGILSYALCTKN